MLTKSNRQLWVAAFSILIAVAMMSCSSDSTFDPYDRSASARVVTGGASIEGTWQPMESGTDEWLWGVWGTANDEVIVVGNTGTALHLRSDAWVAEAMPTFDDMCDVWVAADGVALAVGLGGAASAWDGSNWSRVTAANDKDVFNAFGIPANGSSLVSLLPGVPGTIFAADLEVITVGAEGNISVFSGQELMAIASPTDAGLFGVWAESKTNIYAVGVGGTIVNFTGEVWSFENSPAVENLSNVWGASADDIYAVGDLGTMVHYDGNQWSLVDLGVTQNLYGVWGADANNIFIVGGGGLILYYDGVQWATMDSGTEMDLFKIWGRSVEEIFAVGMNGTILRFGGEVDPCDDADDVCDCEADCDDDCDDSECDDPGPGDDCPTVDEACLLIGEEVDRICSPDADWKSDLAYVWCVIKTTASILHEDRYRECFDKKERKAIFFCVVLDRVPDHGGDDDDGDDDDGDDDDGDDGEGCPSLDDACRIIGERVDETCPTDAKWSKDHDYLSCVIETAKDILHEKEWRRCFNKKERKKILKCIVRERHPDDKGDDDDDDDGDDCDHPWGSCNCDDDGDDGDGGHHDDDDDDDGGHHDDDDDDDDDHGGRHDDDDDD